MTVSSSVKTLFSIVFCIGFGILLAAGIGHLFFNKIPSDFTRTKHLLSFLQQEGQRPDLLLFGNSIAMDGFNAKEFSEKACSPKAYNLSSPGQNQLESILLISSIKSAPKTVVHLFNSGDLANQDYLSSQVVLNFILYDYSPNAFAKSCLSLTNSSPQLSYFSFPWIKTTFESRWLITNFFNTRFRSLLRKDLSLDFNETNFYYPRNYTTRFPDNKRLPLIKQFNPPESVQAFEPDSIKWKLIQKVGRHLKEQNIEYVVLLAPLNPELNNYKEHYFKELDAFINCHPLPNVRFINMSTLLSKEEFVDHVHPSGEGASKITDELAKQLSQCSSKP